MKNNLHSLANYPKAFRGCVVSPTKICLQFEDVEVKLRRNPNNEEPLHKHADNILSAPVKVTGSPVEVSAMGCQLPVLEAAQHALIDAYVHYGRAHSERYRQEYGKEFLGYLLEVQAHLNNAITKLREEL